MNPIVFPTLTVTVLLGVLSGVVAAQSIEYEGAADDPAPKPSLRADQVEYAYDDGAGNVNIGPPSTFDPDMLWGNYFLTQAGGDVITEIRVAFGPTFPSLANGPVTFWLLDDPEMNLDPLSATALVSVEATPDVSGNVFFDVEIPPTQVGGAFFVGASAQLQGGKDIPARVDTDGPPENSWFFYAPDISEVINDLASAPFGTSMDNPEYVPFPGAFMVRAVGIQGEYTPPQAEVDQEELWFHLHVGDTYSHPITLSNLAPEGAQPLHFTATVVEPGRGVELSIHPEAGSIAAGDTLELTLSIDTEGGKANSTYTADLVFHTNDPDNIELVVPVGVHLSSPISTEGVAAAVAELRQNSPNPFAAQTEIAFSLRAGGPVRIDVFDRTGRLVATLLDADLSAGDHVVRWDAAGLAPGVYLYRMRAGVRSVTRRAVVAR